MFMVRVHDRHSGAEYRVNYLRARYPARACASCMRLRGENTFGCHQCGTARTIILRVGLPDNGALVSCGLSVGSGPDEVSPAALAYLIATNQAERVDDKDKGHGGCLSRCVRRGDDRCQW